MKRVRTIFAIVVAISLAALPARLGAIGISAGSDPVVSAMADCASMDDTSCQPAMGASVTADDTMPMSDQCDRLGHNGTKQSGACSTYCNSVSVVPTTGFVTVDVILADMITLAVGTTTDGIDVSPEPHPPKLFLI
jgi:hypothetical protein